MLGIVDYNKSSKYVEQRKNVERVVKSFENLGNLPKAFIFDIDGTVALNNHRKFSDYSKLHLDIINDAVLHVVKGLQALDKGIFILAITSRPFESGLDTVDWCTKHNLIFDSIFTRKAGDTRTDTEVKREIYTEHIKGKFHVVAVFEDRKRNLDMWKEEGLFIFDCSQDPFAQHVF